MPASLPGATLAENLDNPDAGPFVILDPLSGPKGSPLDVRRIDSWTDGSPDYVNDAANQTPSTGGMSTGIGFGANHVLNSADNGIFLAGFNDNQIPGTEPTYAAAPPNGVVSANTVDSTMMYIGGGRMVANPDAATEPGRPFIPDPYTAGVAIAGAGEDAPRDGGLGPAVFTGFGLQVVTAAGAVAAGAAVEGTLMNRSGGALVTGQAVMGVDTTELAAAA